MIKIEEQILQKCKHLKLGVLTCNVDVFNNDQLNEKIRISIDNIKKNYSLDQIRNLTNIIDSKKAYKNLGKDPNRYRLSAEALLKRIVADKGLYQINNVVDIINLLSIESGFSICGFNSDKISGNICLGIGKSKEDYDAIGRGSLNIENLPIFRDSIGAFGSPTSDSTRTQISDKCNKLLLIFLSFSGDHNLNTELLKASELLEQYAKADNINHYIV